MSPPRIDEMKRRIGGFRGSSIGWDRSLQELGLESSPDGGDNRLSSANTSSRTKKQNNKTFLNITLLQLIKELKLKYLFINKRPNKLINTFVLHDQSEVDYLVARRNGFHSKRTICVVHIPVSLLAWISYMRFIPNNC